MQHLPLEVKSYGVSLTIAMRMERKKNISPPSTQWLSVYCKSNFSRTQVIKKKERENPGTLSDKASNTLISIKLNEIETNKLT